MCHFFLPIVYELLHILRDCSMKKEWLDAFTHMTYGIYVLTTRFNNTINGMIASWVTQVSYKPPLILAAVHPNRFSHDLVKNSRIFALHVLDQSQKQLLKRFKGPDPEKKFDGISWENGRTGSPILTDCTAWFDLNLKHHYTPGNHTLFIGEVIDCGTHSRQRPLCTLDYDGMYKGNI